MAWRRYFFIKAGDSNPMLDKKYTNIGSSNMAPLARAMDETVKYMKSGLSGSQSGHLQYNRIKNQWRKV